MGAKRMFFREFFLFGLISFLLCNFVRCFPKFVINTWEFTRAAQKGWDALLNGADCVSSVVAGCTECEINPCASSVGWGGSIDDRGNISLDALVMDGRNHQAGSVAGLFRVKNAIGVAHAVLKYTTHTLLVGETATQFALEMGFPEEQLETNATWKGWEDWRAGNCQPNYRRNVQPDPSRSCGPYRPADAPDVQPPSASHDNHDTIGMISLDAHGDLAVGTSTNGMRFKVEGRSGDTPIIGAGGYVENSIGAAVETGDGDVMMRFSPTFLAVELLGGAAKGDPTLAAELALARIVQYERKFSGAILAYSRLRGRIGAACFGFGRFPFSVAAENPEPLMQAHNVLDARRDPLTGVVVVTVACASAEHLLATADLTRGSHPAIEDLL